ncbi:golgin subfamily A member 6-like protein 22 [Cimex lectularius]|uniref:Uncharacterized protein n=1 Tax=Cimex lectularius TaxID=79782 RepID=A0A8I6TFB9_CIMLE|nr:golgin subfamily A member 6-like protein 22 [Cimex lectularius]
MGDKKTKSKKQRLEMLRQHRAGCKFPMVEDLAEELSDYFDVIGITKVVTNIYRYFYDPYNRTDDPVGFLKSLVKARKKDQRELHKAKRKWYRLLWKEWEIRDEIAKLRTLLGVLAPEIYTEGGDPRPIADSQTPSTETVTKKLDDPSWTNMNPKMLEQNQYAQMELQILKQHHNDQLALLAEQQAQIEKLQKTQQQDVQILLGDFELQIKEYQTYLASLTEGGIPSEAHSTFDAQVLQTQLGQMQTVQKKQVKSLQQTQHHELLTQQNLHKHERIQRLQTEGARQQANLQNMMLAHGQHEQLRMEHQDQYLEIIDEIQEQQQQAFDDALAILENRKVTSIKEPPEQIIKRTQQQLQQLHEKQVEQLLALQSQELHNLDRIQKSIRKEIEHTIKIEQQNLPKQIVHTNLIQHQSAQIAKLGKFIDENKELIGIINTSIEKELIAIGEQIEEPTSKVTEKSEELLNMINQVAVLQEKIMKLQQQMIHQELPYAVLPKVPEHELNFRKIQDVILQQQQRLQQQFNQEQSLRSILEHLHELVSAQKVQVIGSPNIFRENVIQILQDCQEITKKALKLCDKQKMRNSYLADLQEDINLFQISYWKKRQKKDEPIDNLGKSLLKGKLAKGNKKELHPLQKLLFENQAMQTNHVEHQQNLLQALKKAQNVTAHQPIEQEIQLRKQQEKLLLLMLKETEDIEDDQSEELGPLDIQQSHIDELASTQKWMSGIGKLETILMEKSFEKGYSQRIMIEIEDLEPIFQQSHTIQDDHLKLAIAQQEELVSSHEKIVKILSPNQLALTEEQLRRQKTQLNQLKRDLQHFFKTFTDPIKTNKNKSESSEEVHSIKDELDHELKELLSILKSETTALNEFLKEKQKYYTEKMQETAQQVLRHQQKFIKLIENHHHLLAQYQDLHIEPEKQMIMDMMILHKRLGPCLRIQQQQLQRLMYRLRRSQDETPESAKEESPQNEAGKEQVEIVGKSDRNTSRVLRRKSKLSQLSAGSSNETHTLTGVLATGEKCILDVLPTTEAIEFEEKLRSNVLEQRQSVSRLSLLASEQELTEEQKELRERKRLIAGLKDKQAHTLHQVQTHNKPDTFRRVQTLTYPRGLKPRKHEELESMVAEYREKLKTQPDTCPLRGFDVSTVEENQRQLIKLFEKSEKFMLEKRDSSHGASFITMLREIVKDPGSELCVQRSSSECKSRSKGALKK